jgi:hypothetical protein
MARARSRPVRAALAAALALGLPAAAGAAVKRRLYYSDPVAQAVGRAVEFWGGTPCGGTVGVAFGPDAAAPRAGENVPGARGGVAAMWAEWSTPAGRNQFAVPPAQFSECVVHINRAIWPTTQAEDAGFADFCKEMIHEYGHFEGYPDVGARPGTIQYEQPDLARVPLCERFRLRFGERVYTGPPASPHRARARPPRGRR